MFSVNMTSQTDLQRIKRLKSMFPTYSTMTISQIYDRLWIKDQETFKKVKL
jgi:hypothetical protein